MDILEGLNPVQREAVQHTEGPLLLLSGAGSGKTRVITHRIAHLIQEKEVSPFNILAVTFTNKAAEEMKNRLADLVGLASRLLWVSTFHSTCVRLLRDGIDRIGYKSSFTIYDDTDQLTLMKRILKEHKLKEGRVNPRAVLHTISSAKNELVDWQQYAQTTGTVYEETVARLYKDYQRHLVENNSLDFDDLIMLTVRLFREHPDFLEQYQERFQYIMVDEYQDTNRAQYHLIHLLADKYRNLCVVGDDDQAIYGWRGADVSNILDFEKDYSETKVLRLEQNYRSTSNILDAAYEVVRNNRNRKEKRLWTDKPEGNKLLVHEASDESVEAQFIVDTIRKVHEQGRSHADIAVFYRMNAQSRTIEDALRRANIPHKIVGSMRFYERREIKDVLCYLRVLVNPMDGVGLQRIINVPRRGIGNTTMQRIMDYATAERLPLFEAMRQAEQITELRGATQLKLLKFVQMMGGVNLEQSPTDVIEELLEASGYIDALNQEGSVESESRVENVRELLTAAREYQDRDEDPTLAGFLEGVTLVSDTDEYEEGADQVTLMTLHSAKGLEFPVVFLTGMEEGVFPHQRAFQSDIQMEEERRLCYVGITRAEEQVYLTRAIERRIFGNTWRNLMSRFVEEIPPELIEEPEKPKPKKRTVVSSFDPDEHLGNVAPVFHEVDARVSHAKWGRGTIIEISGRGSDARITIKFDSGTKKTLMAEYAKLQPA